MTPLTTSDRILFPVSCVAMTHNLCVEWESASVPVCIWVHVRCGGGERQREREWALMQCFPTLPPPPTLPPLSPPPSSLLCTVDDSDPGQSSETWGERLVPPSCRIYAGNRCSPILSPRVLFKSHVTHFLRYCAAVNTHTHMHVCVFSPCICPLRYSSRMSVFSNNWPTETGEGGGPEECRLHLAGLRECCLLFLSPFSNLMLVICFSACSTDTRGGGKPYHCDG